MRAAIIGVLVSVVSVFSQAETVFNKVGADTQVELNCPADWFIEEIPAIKIRKNGNILVFNRGQKKLLEFDDEYNLVREIGSGLFKNPHGLKIDQVGNIWTADAGNHTVMKFSGDGKLLMVLGWKDKASAGWFDNDYEVLMFDNPLDMSFDSQHNIYIVDKGNSRIVKVDQSGNLLKTWGGKGEKAGEFNFPHSVEIDAQDRIYVADRENQRIQVFDTDGNFISSWNDIGHPYVMKITANSLWVTDARKEIIKEFSLDGQIKRVLQGEKGRGAGQFSSVHGLDVAAGNIWVSQIYNWGGINKIAIQY